MKENPKLNYSLKEASLNFAAVLGCSTGGVVLAAAIVSGGEQILADYFPLINHLSVTTLNHEVEQYNPHLVTPETIVSTYTQAILPIILTGGIVFGLIKGFKK